MLQQPGIHIREGSRDRAIPETFHATGMRRMEMASLKLYDIDHGAVSRVSINPLKHVYLATHPAASLKQLGSLLAADAEADQEEV